MSTIPEIADDIPLGQLGLSTRALNCLRNMRGIGLVSWSDMPTIGNLRKLSAHLDAESASGSRADGWAEYYRTWNMGFVTHREVGLLFALIEGDSPNKLRLEAWQCFAEGRQREEAAADFACIKRVKAPPFGLKTVAEGGIADVRRRLTKAVEIIGALIEGPGDLAAREAARSFVVENERFIYGEDGRQQLRTPKKLPPSVEAVRAAILAHLGKDARAEESA
jgi:hypothetical protein